ncbi:MAG: acyl carrier protein phosphodiesterase [Pseudomonadota bacterium]|nr:acyl carrier protein phosphodiesterase [Pseudomonadota bacterium]
MGDFVRGAIDPSYPETVRRGIRLHRRMDSFADRHPLFQRSRARLQAPYRRFGGILIDIFYDHYLAVHWDRFSPLPLEVYSRQVYRSLARHHRIMPARMRQYVGYMTQRDLLTSYRGIDGIRSALSGVSRRLSRPNPLAQADQELERLRAELEEDFLAFFPQLVTYVRGEVPANSALSLDHAHVTEDKAT